MRLRGPLWVKMRRTRIEHTLSALPLLATEERTFGIGSFVPKGDIRAAADSYYSITSSVATQRALTISVKHDLGEPNA
jgi:hypothetical protein